MPLHSDIGLKPLPPGPGAVKPGFTLVEVIITVLIISIGCLAAMVMQTNALKGNTLADNLTVATFLAESEAERLDSLSFEQLTAEVDDAAVTDGKKVKYLNRQFLKCPNDTPADCPDYLYKMETSYFKNFPTNWSHQVEIKVDWQDNVGAHEVVYSSVFTDLL
ncbi:MAG: prepilin-type N-terminal cleavage/methylation domain-containing protein [Deltaproteobacteria bacterium]|jgi:prepilin-type N-terminal cleavage/methylation domain-containing protein|nr:prepilin-type N-terminal cleavage/methylation domain-containing protein [Deltaproteobacteria bacterium]